MKAKQTDISVSLLNDSTRMETLFSLDPDFLPQKKFKILTKRIRAYLILSLLIALSCYSYLKIRFNTLDIRPLNFCFLSNSILTLLIPLSFLKNIIRTKIIKYNGKAEYEKTSDELQYKIINNSITDILDKRMLSNITNYNQNFYTFCFILMLLWTFATTFLYYGIAFSSAITVNALANISIIIILLGKVLLLKNKVSILKIFAALICMVGLFLLTNFRLNLTNDSISNIYHFPLLGSIFTILSACFYASYVLVLKYYSKRYKHYFDMMEVFGYMGLFNLLVTPFLLIILTLMQVENFSLPSPGESINLFMNAGITCLICDQLQSYAITYFSPVVVAFGIGLIVPFLYGMDMVNLNNVHLNWWYVAGSLLMVVSFVMVVSEHAHKLFKKKSKAKLFD